MKKSLAIFAAAVVIALPLAGYGATSGGVVNETVPSPKLNPQPDPSRHQANQLRNPTYTAKCESNLVMDLQFVPSWLASHVSAPGATTENVSSVKLILQRSLVSEPNVLCFYASPAKDVPNLVYKFPCKNAKAGAARGSYICTR